MTNILENWCVSYTIDNLSKLKLARKSCSGGYPVLVGGREGGTPVLAGGGRGYPSSGLGRGTPDLAGGTPVLIGGYPSPGQGSTSDLGVHPPSRTCDRTGVPPQKWHGTGGWSIPWKGPGTRVWWRDWEPDLGTTPFRSGEQTENITFLHSSDAGGKNWQTSEHCQCCFIYKKTSRLTIEDFGGYSLLRRTKS